MGTVLKVSNQYLSFYYHIAVVKHAWKNPCKGISEKFALIAAPLAPVEINNKIQIING